MFLKMFEEHPGMFLGLAIGIFVGIIFLLVGFWKTIIFLSFIGIGLYIGRRFDNSQDIRDVLHDILPDKFFK